MEPAAKPINFTGEGADAARVTPEELAELFEHITDGVIVIGPDWRFRHINEPAARMLGRDGGEPARPSPLGGVPLRTRDELPRRLRAGDGRGGRRHRRRLLRAARPVVRDPPVPAGWADRDHAPRRHRAAPGGRGAPRGGRADVGGRADRGLRSLEVGDRDRPGSAGRTNCTGSTGSSRAASRAPSRTSSAGSARRIATGSGRRSRKSLQEGGTFSFEETIVRPDGAERIVSSRGHPITGADGRVESLVGVCQDVTDRATAETCTIATAITEGTDRSGERLERESWRTWIDSVLSEGRMRAYAQPIVDLRSGEAASRELLARIVAPGTGGEVLEPGSFLPAAERFGLVQRGIDCWMVRRALDQPLNGLLQVNLSALRRSAIAGRGRRSSTCSRSGPSAPSGSCSRSPRPWSPSTSTQRSSSPPASASSGRGSRLTTSGPGSAPSPT